jgi:diadenosine tetraphosphatase ApaH/serine/threonine PP2A family protein phosphatase
MLGIEQVIDVYHALEYVVVLMNALGWSEVEQTAERRLWCKGAVNAGDWLATFGPVVRALPVLSAEVLQALGYGSLWIAGTWHQQQRQQRSQQCPTTPTHVMHHTEEAQIQR